MISNFALGTRSYLRLTFRPAISVAVGDQGWCICPGCLSARSELRQGEEAGTGKTFREKCWSWGTSGVCMSPENVSNSFMQMGMEFRDSTYLLSAKNSRALKAGMVFNLALGFQDLEDSGKK